MASVMRRRESLVARDIGILITDLLLFFLLLYRCYLARSNLTDPTNVSGAILIFATYTSPQMVDAKCEIIPTEIILHRVSRTFVSRLFHCRPGLEREFAYAVRVTSAKKQFNRYTYYLLN